MASKDFLLKFKALDKVSGPVSQIQSKMKSLSQSTEKAKSKFSALRMKSEQLKRSLKSAGNSMKSLGRSMTTRMTLPIIGAGFAIGRTALNFQKGMNKVKAVTGATGETFTALENKALDLGATSAFTATQVADSMGFLGMAGFKTNEILATTKDTLDLAAAGGLELGMAADIASNVIGGFNMEATEMGRVADVIARAATSSNVSVEQVGESLKYAAPLASKMNVSLEETAAALGVLGDAGIQASMAGTSMRAIFASLAAPKGDALEVLTGEKYLATKIKDRNGNLRKFGDILNDITKGMKTMSKADQIRALEMIFGRRALSSIMVLLQAQEKKVKVDGKEISALEEKTEKMRDVNVTAEKMAEIMQEGAVGAFNRFYAALERFSIEVGKSGFMDHLTSIVEKLTEFFGWLSENPKILEWGTNIAIIAAVLGPFIMSMGTILSMFGSLSILWLALGSGATGTAFLATFTAVAGVAKGLVVTAGILAGKFLLIAGAFYLGYKLGEGLVKLWKKIDERSEKIKKNKIKESYDTLNKEATSLAPELFPQLKGMGKERKAPEFGKEKQLLEFLEQRNIKEKGSQSKIKVQFENVPSNVKINTREADFDGLDVSQGFQGAAGVGYG